MAKGRRSRSRAAGAEPASETTALVPATGTVATTPQSDGPVGVVEFTAAEREVLARPVDPSRVLTLSKTGIVYLSHIDYTRWLNEAVGPGQWAIAPVGEFKYDAEKSIVYAVYRLYIRGVAVAEALGEQEYHETNRNQTYGDAIESTVASALRRCCKRLGMALELWDAGWIRQFKRDAESRKTTPKHARRGKKPTSPPNPTSVDTRPITDAQRKRLFAIMRGAGRTKEELSAWLLEEYELSSTKGMSRALYDEIVQRLEAPGPLVNTGTGEVIEGEVLSAVRRAGGSA